jgi:hypothetical protein
MMVHLYPKPKSRKPKRKCTSIRNVRMVGKRGTAGSAEEVESANTIDEGLNARSAEAELSVPTTAYGQLARNADLVRRNAPTDGKRHTAGNVEEVESASTIDEGPYARNAVVELSVSTSA